MSGKKKRRGMPAKTPKQLTPYIETTGAQVPKSLDADLRKYMEVCADRLGMVPQCRPRHFALRPEKLRTFIAKYNELMLSDETGLSAPWSAR